jgi:hypothetical protein
MSKPARKLDKGTRSCTECKWPHNKSFLATVCNEKAKQADDVKFTAFDCLKTLRFAEGVKKEVRNVLPKRTVPDHFNPTNCLHVSYIPAGIQGRQFKQDNP